MPPRIIYVMRLKNYNRPSTVVREYLSIYIYIYIQQQDERKIGIKEKNEYVSSNIYICTCTRQRRDVGVIPYIYLHGHDRVSENTSHSHLIGQHNPFSRDEWNSVRVH